MSLNVPKKIGPERVVAKFFSKSIVVQDYLNPRTGKVDSWGCFRGNLPFSFILPITIDEKVVSIRQFRYGIGEVIHELPAGNIQPGESPVNAAARELLEETGYKAEQIISLSNNQPIWNNPAGSDIYFYPFLGLDCTYMQGQNLDQEEVIEVELVDIYTWLKMVSEVRANSAVAMLTTLLAIPHLDFLKSSD